MKILIVDDDENSRIILRKTLESEGHTIKAAVNGEEALSMARKSLPDMIISDILMPVMDGFRFCCECKRDEKLKDIPFIFYTATYVDGKDEDAALKMRADRFIRKPVEPDELMEIIRSVIKDAGNGKTGVGRHVPIEEKEILKLYSERLVNKLEKKMLSLEKEIAERKQAEEKLRKAEKRFRRLANLLPQTVFEMDERGKLIFVNRNAFDIFGYTQEDFDKGLTVLQIIAPEDRDRAGKNIQKALSGEKLYSSEYMAQRKNGSSFPVIVYSRPMMPDNKIIGLRGIVVDITERKQTEETLKQSYEKLQEALEGAIHALAATAERRDPYTAGHQKRVAELACAIAEEMNLQEEPIKKIHISAIIHDIGKINVPSEILSKPGRLSKFEFEIIKTHPQVGCDILKQIKFPWPIAAIVLQHHERLDGSGYPNGVSGEDICLEARILSVADVVEAMSSHRPYRPALGIDKALEEISQNKGILYDPNVVDACVKIFADKKFLRVKRIFN
ncbi:MAG: PAS domain S-box protein [Desulfobacterales bacterium]|nr:PAS domain S-box protein [Desulfobacterales bacterium]